MGQSIGIDDSNNDFRLIANEAINFYSNSMKSLLKLLENSVLVSLTLTGH